MLSIQDQLTKLRDNKIHFSIVKPSTLGDGIHELSIEQQTLPQTFFDQHGSILNPLKFIPASGLASRMFLFLREIINSFDPFKDSIEKYSTNNHKQEFQFFVNHSEEFSFCSNPT